MKGRPDPQLSAIYGTTVDPSLETAFEKLASGQVSVGLLEELPSEVLIKLAETGNIEEALDAWPEDQPDEATDVEINSEDLSEDEMEKVAMLDFVGRSMAAQFAESILLTKEAEVQREATPTPGEALIARIRAMREAQASEE